MTSLLGLCVRIVIAAFLVVRPSDAFLCPESCSCRHTQPHGHLLTDCSRRGLSEFPERLDPSTVYLDLSRNGLEVIPKDAFVQLRELQTVRLNDNWILDVPPNTFKGLRLRVLDLSRNQIEVLSADSLAGIRGRPDCSSLEPCVLDLRENGIKRVERNSMSWISGMDVLLGDSQSELTLEAYAFYGAENMTRLRVGGVPRLVIQPRVFTNTVNLRRLEIFDARVAPLHKFALEGLKNVGDISLTDCHLDALDEFTFSGITYAPEVVSVTAGSLDPGPQYSPNRPGGTFNVTGSSLTLRTDMFRDTNLQTLIVSDSHVAEVLPHAFRGLHELSLLRLASNTIGVVHSEALGGLKSVQHVVLTQNDIGQLNEHVFHDSHSIETLSLHIRPQANLTLSSNSFSGLRDVGVLEIVGSVGSSVSVSKDTFHDLGGVEELRISNVSLPVLGHHSFRGLSKVQVIRFEHCNISQIDPAAFGEARATGAVASIELNEGNQLPCDCDTNHILRELEARFSQFSVTCQTSSGLSRVLTEDTLDWPSCLPSGAARGPSVGLGTWGAVLGLAIVILMRNSYTNLFSVSA